LLCILECSDSKVNSHPAGQLSSRGDYDMTILTGCMENLNHFYQFGFVIDDAGRKAFLHSDVLLKGGFTKEQVTKTSVLVVEVVKEPKGLKAVSVVSLDGRAGTALKVTNVMAPKPAVKPPVVTLVCFLNTKQIDCNKERGECLFSVKTNFGKMVQYLVADSTGLVLRQLGRVSLQEARLAIGKVITPPMPLKYGVKTNNPEISRQMSAGSGNGGGKKKVVIK